MVRQVEDGVREEGPDVSESEKEVQDPLYPELPRRGCTLDPGGSEPLVGSP